VIATGTLPVVPAGKPGESAWRRIAGAALRWGGITVAALGMAGLAAILALSAVHTIGSDPQPSSPATPTFLPRPTASATPSPGTSGATQWSIGTTFVNGDFAMTVLGVEGSLTQIGESGTWTSEEGQFVVISVELEYTGRVTGYFPPDEQRLTVTSGATYVNDVESSFRAQANALGQEALRPGVPQRGCLVFDIPTNETPVALEFVGDILSTPVTIPLG
jgi:hypothetical protein